MLKTAPKLVWFQDVGSMLNNYLVVFLLKTVPKLVWFQDVESMLNNYLVGLPRPRFWVGHQVHVSLPINQFLKHSTVVAK